MSAKSKKQRRGGGKPKQAQAQGAASAEPKQGRRYPMPCPGCRKMIDARDHLCPYCGIDTDAKLAPLRAAFPIIAVGLAIAIASVLTCCKGNDTATPQATPVGQAAEGGEAAAREVEPNDTLDQATPIESTARVRGAIAPGERDLFRVELTGHGGQRLHAGVDSAAPAGLRIAVLDAKGEPRGEAVAPARIGSLGAVAGVYFVAVEGAEVAGAYELAVEAIAAGDGVEWEPNDEPSQASKLIDFRSAATSEAGEARTLGATAGRGWWSSATDVDCFALPARLRGGVELAVEVQPPPEVAVRLAVWDAPAEQGGERRLLARSASAKVGEAHAISVGTWAWKEPLVLCVSAARGAAFAAPYRLSVKALVPKDGDAVDLEPNDELRTAQHVPPELTVRGHLADGDADLFVLEPRPEAALTATVAPRAGRRTRLALLDGDGRELAHADAGDDGAATVKAAGAVYVVVRAGAGESAEASAGDTTYELELAVGDEAPKAKPKPKPAKKACSADAQHCCLANGKIVRPGGCQPSYPPNVQPATRRGPDGRCEKIACYLKCLPATATIATPRGDVEVSRLAVGDQVWTVDADGRRVAAALARVEAREVQGTHSVVELSLADGRVLRASAGHPTAAGGQLGDVAVDQVLDGAKVVGRRVLAYEGAHTWDILPQGPTGQYWADGVLVGSTLR